VPAAEWELLLGDFWCHLLGAGRACALFDEEDGIWRERSAFACVHDGDAERPALGRLARPPVRDC